MAVERRMEPTKGGLQALVERIIKGSDALGMMSGHSSK